MEPADVVEPGLFLPLPGPAPRAVRERSSVSLALAEERFSGISFRGSATASARSMRRPPPRPVMGARAGRMEQDLDERFLHWLLERGGLAAASYRLDPLIRRLPACLRALRVDSVECAWTLLASRPARVPVALESLLIGTTELFRDAAVFRTLEEEVLPGILARTRVPRIWSAACSDGAELYSVAMLLAKAGALHGSYLLGTDCRVEAIGKAHLATYVWRHFPPGLTGCWQPLPGGRVMLAPDLRRAVRWQLSDLMAEDTGLPCVDEPWDLILCRNLAIYLKPEAARSLWDRLAMKLAPDGYLVVGKAEKPRSELLRRVAPSIYCRCNPRRTPS